MSVNNDINELLPVMRRGAQEFIKRCEAAGHRVRIFETYRSRERQQQLFAQGRTAPGSIVTNTMTSPHMYRIAFDFIRADGRPGWDDTDGFFGKCGAIWRDMGGTWGGDWRGFVDKPHCEFTTGKPYSWFAAGNTLPADTYMKWEAGNEIRRIDIKVVENGVESYFSINRILKEGSNFIAARQLGEILGFKVSFENGIPVFEK